MDREASDVLSALVDGESVDPDELGRALEAPEVRAMLVDFVRLRHAVHAGSEPAAELVDRVRQRLRPRLTPWRAARTAAAAMVLALALLGALSVAGLLWAPPPVDTPPKAGREIPFEPGVDWRRVEGARP